MYPIERKRLAALGTGRWHGVGANVYFLGLTSLLTDVSSEMVTSILPLYALYALGLTPLQYGVIDGLYQGAAALSRLAGGMLADRWQRNREVAAAGYALSAACKPALLAVGGIWGALAAVIALDRIGKGIRTPSRTAHGCSASRMPAYNTTPSLRCLRSSASPRWSMPEQASFRSTVTPRGSRSSWAASASAPQ